MELGHTMTKQEEEENKAFIAWLEEKGLYGEYYRAEAEGRISFCWGIVGIYKSTRKT